MQAGSKITPTNCLQQSFKNGRANARIVRMDLFLCFEAQK